MSAIRSAIEELAGEDIESLDVDRIGDDLIEIETVVGLLEVERARRISMFQSKNGHLKQHYPSMTAWLKDRCRMAGGRARLLVARSRRALHTPKTFRAWSDTRLSTDQTERLLAAARSDPLEFEKVEATLAVLAEELSVADVGRMVEYWSQAVSRSPAEVDIYRAAKRGVSLSETIDGMYRIDGWLTPSAGSCLGKALDALTPPPRPGETRTPTQRRHDALEDLARDYLDHGESPTVGGEKPNINVLCDLEALRGVAGGIHETEAGAVLTINKIRELACDSSVSRIVVGPSSEILDVGRKTRVIPAGLRRAVILRDRQCTWIGCDRDARWCDIHHIIHWADGGETGLENLKLLCRFHHGVMHQHGDRAPPTPGSGVSFKHGHFSHTRHGVDPHPGGRRYHNLGQLVSRRAWSRAGEGIRG